jgi:hypothetical protein
MVRPFDTSIPNVARIYDALLGGKNNYESDRVAAEKILKIVPDAAAAARQNRNFLRRAVWYLTIEMGVRQFLDIGSGLPTGENVHEVAQSLAPESRIVYVDNDPIVLAHARALLISSPEGKCDYVDSDISDTGIIITHAAETLNFAEPIAVLLIAIMHFIPDAYDPRKMVDRLLDAVPAGSYLVLSHATAEHFTDDADKERLNGVYAQTESGGVTPRPLAEVRSFFKGMELVSPGVVDIAAWRAEAGAQTPASRTLFYGGAARKPLP